MLKTIAVALSMYSAVPMPQVMWTPKHMRYAMIAFPLVGVLCGVSIYLWFLLSNFLNFNVIIQSIGLVLFPIFVNGGIHLDGLCDTTDAIASHAPLEKKLEILKDSNAGAFAVIAAICYLLFFFGVYTQLSLNFSVILVLTIIQVFSRCLSGISVATFPCAKNSGLLYAFQDGAARRVVTWILTLFAVILTALLCLLASWTGLLISITGLAVFLFYRVYALQTFGGITGDLAGWFLCLAEFFMVFSFVIGGILWS